jgi:metal-responsive CopG/Arc/MetJ family transcriptional regulator
MSDYERAVQPPAESRMQKVSVTVDRGLLSLVDHYAQSHQGLTRSEIFDQALELWAKHVQRQADIACYASANKNKQSTETADWAAIQAEAARFIW